MSASFTVDECRNFLHRAGWSAGETGSASAWLVTGTRGKARIYPEAATQGVAWWQACVQACAVAYWCGWGGGMDEAKWLTSTHFQAMYSYLKKGQGMALTKGGRRKFRLLACGCCRLLLWHLPVADCYRQAVEAAEAFADGRLARKGMEAAALKCPPVAWPPGDSHPEWWAAWSMAQTTLERAATAAYDIGQHALNALAPKDRPANRQRLCDLVRCVFGNPFGSLGRRTFPAHVVELARECYDAFPAVSDRFLILADALDDLGEDGAAKHCRQREHAKGCHVLDAILGRS